MIFDSIIIGKGPAGITAGIYLKRANWNVLIIGKDGGALEKTKKIDNYYGFRDTISGKDLLKEGFLQAERLGVELETDEVLSIEKEEYFIVETRNNKYKAKTVILATGTNRNTPKIKGIKEFEGRGVSYCAICDAFFYRNKDVAVLGAGDYAIKEARTLLPVAKSVTILTNGEQIVENRDETLEEFIIEDREISEITGNEKLERVILKQRKDENVEPNVQENRSDVLLDGVFVAIGTASSTDFAKKLGVFVEDNNIKVDENMATNLEGLYACGDCTGGLLQISKAVYEGSKAGIACAKYLRGV